MACDKLVVAVPPSAELLRIIDLDDKEKAAFSKTADKALVTVVAGELVRHSINTSKTVLMSTILTLVIVVQCSR